MRSLIHWIATRDLKSSNMYSKKVVQKCIKKFVEGAFNLEAVDSSLMVETSGD